MVLSGTLVSEMSMNIKKCSKCKKIKYINEFRKRKDSSKYRNECKKCEAEYSREGYKNNPIKGKEIQKRWRENNREEERGRGRERYKNNSEKEKKRSNEYRKNNLEKYKEFSKNWRKDNRELSNFYSKIAFRKRMLNPTIKLSKSISNRINYSLKNGKGGYHWEELVNYTLQDLMDHLEKLFKPNMRWSNHGKAGWEIDHIIPISLWQFESCQDREFKQCWALCNLQPLWTKDNLLKGDKVF